MTRGERIRAAGPDVGRVASVPVRWYALTAGRRLYEQHCAACHGTAGLGDGEAGAALNPALANVAMASKLPIASDAYLYWTIAEGGAPVGSAMPPFEAALDENAIWQIVLY